MTTLRFLAVVLAGSALACLRAQVVHVGGSSPDYTDLPAAVAGAAPGDILVVHPGKYRGFSTNKPLRIHLDFDATNGAISPAPGAAYAITVNGLPASGSFTLSGDGALVFGGSLGAIRIANTAGRVVVEGLRVVAGAAAAIDVQNTGPVLLHDCDLVGTPGLLAQTTTIAGNELRVSSPFGNAVAATHATLDFAGGSFRGNDLPALSLFDCGIRLAGDGATSIKVGGPSTSPVPAFVAVNGLVEWDPSRFLLVGANGAPGYQFGGGTSTSVEDPPTLTARGGAPGATGWIRLTANTPVPGGVVLGPFVQPTFFGLSGLYVDLAVAGVLLIGLVDPTGLSASFQMPTTPALLGDVSCVQGIVLNQAGQYRLSGPVPLIEL